MMKRIVTIQDISCFGKCSSTVALPLISAMGVEAAVIPTAVLSTHTGGFTGYTFRDLTADIPKIAQHWKSLQLELTAFTPDISVPESRYRSSPISSTNSAAAILKLWSIRLWAISENFTPDSPWILSQKCASSAKKQMSLCQTSQRFLFCWGFPIRKTTQKLMYTTCSASLLLSVARLLSLPASNMMIPITRCRL